MKLSFKKRIATYNLIAIAALTAIAFITIYGVVYYTSYKHLDDDITTEKAEVFSNLDWEEDTIIMNKMPEWEEAEHKQLEVNPTFIQIVDLNGETVFKSANLQGNHFLFDPKNKATTFYNATINNQRIRQGQFPVYNNDKKIIGQLTIGVSQQESYNVLHNLLIVLSVIYIFILSILYFIMSFVASKAIAPIHQLIESTAKINYSNINSRLPLPENEDEIYRLATTINELLNRLESSFYQQKQFTSDASHEMQTPLAAIKGIIEVLLRKPRTAERYEEKMREVLLQTNRLSQLYDQLLQLAQLESTTLVTKKEHFFLEPAIKKIIKNHEALIKSNAIQIQNSVPSDASVWADPLLLEMILDNLISNAIKYNKMGGGIFLSWDAATGILSVKDEGVGIDADQLPLLFNRFFRADESRSSQIPGNGLGLSIAKRLCDALNIILTVSSVKGKGTTFQLQFPA
ncbi:signal transduction histidine kinase [Flavobacterium nitrogenifigens]|uniref:histidine kinase n=2 Tax=Flavobacterium TaxID=237 RepID=A0A7W7IZK2_9FLAO|nr:MULTISPECIES: HAMP domain-containing sensor histidine kinase [Flavobacterium]MBB4803486.1 signal transduction histidine kinase [Flavobacterium nitrogenifigens]MBB6388709.1 signal transduction histidine kinase [Flavobacterium notoginsengisoli]